jgi:hypothetical protein
MLPREDELLRKKEKEDQDSMFVESRSYCTVANKCDILGVCTKNLLEPRANEVSDVSDDAKSTSGVLLCPFRKT